MAGILLFVLPFLTGIIGAHYLLYFTVVRFFQVNTAALRFLIFFVPFGLTMSVAIAVALLFTHRNAATQVLILAAMLWIGFFINLLLAVACVWLFRLGTLLAGVQWDMRVACFFALAGAVLLTGWGVWNARAPQVTNVPVRISNLPAQWKDKTIVHLSDMHLGPIRGVEYLSKVVGTVNDLDPAAILITGDLFDGMSGDFDKFVAPLNELRATHGVLFVTGNHEGYLGLAKPLAAIRETHFRILDNEVADVDGIQIVGISFPEHDKNEESKAALKLTDEIKKEMPSILMFHTPTDIALSPTDRGAQQHITYFSPNTNFSFAKANGIDLQLSGHTHQGQFFPFTLVTRLIFKGFDYGLHKDGDFHIYITSGTGTWGPPMRTGSRSEVVAIRLQ
jgi:uncharacterized protein